MRQLLYFREEMEARTGYSSLHEFPITEDFNSINSKFPHIMLFQAHRDMKKSEFLLLEIIKWYLTHFKSKYATLINTRVHEDIFRKFIYGRVFF